MKSVDDGVRASYGWRWLRYQLLGMFTVFLVAGVFAAVASANGAMDGGLAFLVFWYVALVWNAVWWLWLFSHWLELTGETLRWRTPLRHGEMRLEQVSRITDGRVFWPIVTIHTADGSRVRILPGKGLVPFLDELRAAAPHLDVSLRQLTRFSERWPGWSRFHRN